MGSPGALNTLVLQACETPFWMAFSKMSGHSILPLQKIEIKIHIFLSHFLHKYLHKIQKQDLVLSVYSIIYIQKVTAYSLFSSVLSRQRRRVIKSSTIVIYV